MAEAAETVNQNFNDFILTRFSVLEDHRSASLSTCLGMGHSTGSRLEKGLSVSSIEFTLLKDSELYWNARKWNEEQVFQLCYFLSGNKTNLFFNDQEFVLPSKQSSCFAFFSNDTKFKAKFAQKDPTKLIVITFTHSWLLQYGIHLAGYWDQVPVNGAPNYSPLMGQPCLSEYQLFSSIAELLKPGNNRRLQIKLHALHLLDNFFEKEKSQKETTIEIRSALFLQMIQLEKRIAGCLKLSLPLIKDLAKEFSMSESNLQRHFMHVYGKSVYDYYLIKKMEMARTMLIDSGMPVSKVAYELSYQKVTSFTKAFKKVYGVLPKDIKKEASFSHSNDSDEML